ncbi:unnamed protein product [Amaranthus hypochondriacus]
MNKFTVQVIVMAATLVILSSTAEFTAAQSSGDQTPTCASKLVACVDYLNATTTPPSSCCNPLKEAVTNEKTCLCDIYSNPSLIQAFHINLTQALNLPKLCRIDTGKSPDICNGTTASPPKSSNTSGSISPGNAFNKITGTGFVSSLLVFVAYSMFY